MKAQNYLHNNIVLFPENIFIFILNIWIVLIRDFCTFAIQSKINKNLSNKVYFLT
jgi:hypothetical protein